jgi:hypothetical protein
MPRPPIVANCEIKILWSNTLNEQEARMLNNSTWSPNHFVPVLSPFGQREFDGNSQLASLLVVSSLSMYENLQILRFI